MFTRKTRATCEVWVRDPEAKIQRYRPPESPIDFMNSPKLCGASITCVSRFQSVADSYSDSLLHIIE